MNDAAATATAAPSDLTQTQRSDAPSASSAVEPVLTSSNDTNATQHDADAGFLDTDAAYDAALETLSRLQAQLAGLRSAIPALLEPLTSPTSSPQELYEAFAARAHDTVAGIASLKSAWFSREVQDVLERARRNWSEIGTSLGLESETVQRLGEHAEADTAMRDGDDDDDDVKVREGEDDEWVMLDMDMDGMAGLRDGRDARGEGGTTAMWKTQSLSGT